MQTARRQCPPQQSYMPSQGWISLGNGGGGGYLCYGVEAKKLLVWTNRIRPGQHITVVVQKRG